MPDMQKIYTITTSAGLITITDGLPEVPEPSMGPEGSSTVLRVGQIEVLIDPDERSGAEAADAAERRGHCVTE